MSFNSRLGSSRVHRGRPSNKFHRDPQGPLRLHEDAQPNELLRKRDVSGPPTVRSSAPQYHRSWRGHHPSRGRGNAPSPRRWSIQGSSAQSRPWGSVHERPSRNTRSPIIAGPPHAAAASQVEVVPLHLPLQDPLPPIPPSDPVQGPVFGTERQGQSAAEGITATVHSSVESLSPSGMPGCSSSDVCWPPRKRRKVAPSDSSSHNHRPRESPPTATPSTNFRSPSNDGTTSSDGQTSAYAVWASVASSSNSLASASDILLTDITLPPDRNSITPLVPIPKRLKTIPPSAAALACPPPSSTSDNAAPPPAVQETYSAPSTASSSTSSPAPPSMQVKLERSPSPSLAPRLVTEGCVRIAPLPPECRNRQPDFQAARQRLAAAEMKKLNALGLQIIRVFTREDGMVIDWKSRVPVLWDTLRPPPPLSSPGSGPKAVGVAPDASLAGGARMMSPPAQKLVQPQTAQTDTPNNKPQKRRKRKASTSGIQGSAVVTKPSAGSSAESTSDPQQIAGPSQSAAAFIVSPPAPALPASNKRRDPTPPRRMPPTAKKSAARPSVPRPSSVDLREGGLFSFAIPAPPEHAAGPIHRIPQPSELNPTGKSKAIHHALLATGPSSCPPSNSICPGSTATSSALPSVHAHIAPPIQSPVPPPIQGPTPPVPRCLPSPGPTLALSPIFAHTPPVHIAQEELSDAALDFLERYLHVFTVARASLSSAYAPTALFSLHIHKLEPEETKQHPLRRGPNAIVAGLIALPPNMTLCEWPTEVAGSAAKAHKIQWDVGCVPGSASGDVLVVCYALQEHVGAGRDKDKGKGKEKQREGPGLPAPRTTRWSIQQRFVLRRRDQDAGGRAGEGNEADRIAAALWPLVAVSHQMRVRELP
ncbi:hypothetical protein GSI_13104 [Ganoderma sinense ZZ0214-1]|uniref:NTF2 domain-containing protein n=1 Tax=Ganoderma sinense ZZ0214-1 TaxID=1077348 RepID=A0A2G8RUM4_9APHY|nr:hypothetical protein GSI_13104 [Ganoderma sinense ZZ0214-1]